MIDSKPIKSVAVIGAGAAGVITAAALSREKYFDTIRVFERRDGAGGTWIYDADPTPPIEIAPGKLPPDVDPPLSIPKTLPTSTPPNRQERFEKTPIYDSLTTNVPDIAMSFSDIPFPGGPFVPHEVPHHYLEDYVTAHKLAPYFVFNTTVEDVSKLPSPAGRERWKLTLRRHAPDRAVDEWWSEEFDAVVIGNGHYSVPFIPEVKGLKKYTTLFPTRITHSKYYRTPHPYANKRVLIIGNSASGHDITAELVSHAALPVYQSRRTASRWDGPTPPPGMAWKPIISEFLPSGRIVFEDGSHLDDMDAVVYATGYRASFPFWNARANGGPIWDYQNAKVVNGYWHTFLHTYPTIGLVGVPRVLTFRSWEYQAITLARLFAGRLAKPLPPVAEQRRWERRRLERTGHEGLKFHDVQWETGETHGWLRGLFEWAGLGTLEGEGRLPPALTKEVVWAIEHLRKYPEPGKGGRDEGDGEGEGEGAGEDGWVVVTGAKKDLLHFV
ncbi:FAD/NAD(P)-binding domain-containing protein [Mytilinidion resinicola]|uniref:FAD/NAD(P)-binding domain-containing protein n=1 Tax=Mytilinidion resinicola TaxID=574789 RepID=A0A6A6XZ83_9PEZI|nr:FAD/NAD(P)-binding domain-containing protein [Mytilinidion resinicola]KAF2801886.1 FAD/NAD(P)-binding domain-containing protein [Mytilinidion resinicola]